MIEKLDQIVARFVEKLELPKLDDLTRASELLGIEGVVATEVLREKFRQPLLEEFDRATSPEFK